METLPLGVLHCEVYGCRSVSEDDLTGFQFTVTHIHAGHRLWVLNGLECLCLPRYSDEDEEDGDDGLLVHILF